MKELLMQKLTSRKLWGAFGLVVYLLVQGTPAAHSLAVVTMAAYMLIEGAHDVVGVLASRPSGMPPEDVARLTSLVDTVTSLVGAFVQGATPPTAAATTGTAAGGGSGVLTTVTPIYASTVSAVPAVITETGIVPVPEGDPQPNSAPLP